MPADDKTIRRFQREIAESERNVENYSNRLEQLYTNWLRDGVDEFRAATSEPQRNSVLARLTLNRFTPDIEAQLVRSLELYSAELGFIQGRFRIDPSDTVLTQNIARVETASLRSELMNTAAAVSSTLAFAAAGLAPDSVDFQSIRESFLDGKFHRIQVGLHTNLAGFRSSYEIRKAESIADNPKFEYVGPRDDKNRPFCRFVLSNRRKEWTREQIAAELDSHPDAQLQPTFVYGGGYNCRHRWIYTRRA